jgi:hypothetical protein
MSVCADTHGCVTSITRVYVSYVFKICNSCLPLNNTLHYSLQAGRYKLMMLERRGHTEWGGRLHLMTYFHFVACEHVQRILTPRDSSVGTATGYGLDDHGGGGGGGGGSSPGRVKNFHFSISSRPALGYTQPPIKWVPGALSRR